MAQRKRLIPALLLVGLGLSPGCGHRTIDFPGYIYVLADSTIYEITGLEAAAIRSGVRTAALAPDGQALLLAEDGGTSFLNFKTGEEKKLADRPARNLGWNSDGSRFYILSDPIANQLAVGDRLGKLRVVYRGPRLLAPAASDAGEANPAAASEPVAAEISGCLFLDPSRLIFLAYEGVLSTGGGARDISANRAYLVNLDAAEPEPQPLKFPVDERWTFVDVDDQTGAVLAVIEKKSSGEFRPYLAQDFRTWDELQLETLVPGTFIHCANGDYDLLFQPGTGIVGGITVLPEKKTYRAVFTQFDPGSRETKSGPDLGWGDNIVRPAYHPDGAYAAILVYAWEKRWTLKVVDLETLTVANVWTLPAPKGGSPNVNDRILAWMR